ncbi:MAG: chemotaxis protein CheB [Myxococcales bacterium]|nr:chemotaxis protein CheB [Myxococcales bacterium]
MNANPLRLLVVDDSALCRELLCEALEAERDIAVVGQAASGTEALRRVDELKPDLVTMDVRMPGMDGLQTVSQLMAERPLPILIVTELPAGPDDQVAFEALRRGALDVARKPVVTDAGFGKDLRERVRWLAKTPVVLHPRPSRDPSLGPPPGLRPHSAIGLVGVGASAGGPSALSSLLGALPGDFGATVAVVQHLPAGFAAAFASYLEARTKLSVVIAEGPIALRPATVVLPPDDCHLICVDGSMLAPGRQAPRNGHRPSVDRLFESLAPVGAKAAAVLLSGIGSDGAEGMLRLRQRGGLTIAQDECSSAVYGMPRAALQCGAAAHVLSPQRIARALVQAVTLRAARFVEGEGL